MVIKIINGPEDMPVSLEEARNAARVNGTDHDGEITALVNALTAEAEHIIGQVIINRTYQVTLDSFTGLVPVPALPVGQVIDVSYFDADGLPQTLSTELWQLDESYDPPALAPVLGGSWPATAERRGAVTITYVAGYGSSSASTPAVFKGYVLAKVREYFAPAGTPENPNLIRLLDSLKVY
jgi:uncharacterized phiE125 gp8 family phage protein